MRLTDQQQAIVQHNTGPALAFAVAGAGKTTAMVHRIARLVEEGVFPAGGILATSYNRGAADALRDALAPWPACARVRTWTLHSLGLRIIQRAQEQELIPPVAHIDDKKLLFATLNEARRRHVSYRTELDQLDQEDFLAYISLCKGNLQYPQLERVKLPPSALALVKQATAPLQTPWYLDLYQVFEEMRKREGRITFDDMLLGAWEALVTHPTLLERVQNGFEAVLVDEFQDVNLVQAELLDLLSAPHRNYMVIGDDDQTIYEWRGADPRFILGFEQRYNATVYTITDNFRCQASQVVLANAVIRHNRMRHPKALSLTQGFGGNTLLHEVRSLEHGGQQVADTIAQAVQHGLPLRECAVLVRVFAQTPPIEHALIAAHIPYRLPNDTAPFYRRAEVLDLLHYVTLAQLELTLRAGKSLDEEQQRAFVDAWGVAYRKPKWYITKDISTSIAQAVLYRGQPLVDALGAAGRDERNGRGGGRLGEFAEVIRWLADNVNKLPASELLATLDARIGYRDYLRKNSGFVETGEGRAATVSAFIAYARGRGTMAQLHEHLAALDSARQADARIAQGQCVTLTTIYRAKGREWSLVLVPNCNQGILPFEGHDGVRNLEEERRLLYVAITRAKQHLHLFWVKGSRDDQLSPFLRQADVLPTLGQVTALQAALAKSPTQWTAQEALVVATYPRRLLLTRYFTHWWDATHGERASVAARALAFIALTQQERVSKVLGVLPDDQTFWHQWAGNVPAATPTDFPGWDELLAPARAAPSKQPSSTTSSGATGPVRPKQVVASVARPPTLAVGDRVWHATFYEGVVRDIAQQVDDDKLLTVLTIDFVVQGTKTLIAEYARLQRL
jgi:DNA helicase II / ATP-dependent DNA helicase PcrA